MRKLNVTVIVGLLVAALGAALVLSYGRSVDRRVAKGSETVPVLVAKQDLAAGAFATSLGSSLELSRVPRKYAVDRPLGSLSQLPPGVVLRAAHARGAQLSLADFTTPAEAAAVMPEKGNVALAISVGLTPGVARYVTAGSQVDIFYTASLPGLANVEQVTKLFASGVKVLSVSVALPAGSRQQQQTSETGDVLTVLDVDPVLAQKIVNATTTGKLYLGLVAPGDHHTTKSGSTPTDIFASNR